MKNKIYSGMLIVLGLALSVVACAPSTAEWTDADRSAITALSDRYLQALVDDDMDALASLFVEDGIRLVDLQQKTGQLVKPHLIV